MKFKKRINNLNRLDDIFPLCTKQELTALSKEFHFELIRSFSNQKSSLPCILNPISKLLVNEGEGVAISIGGTNGYISLFKIKTNGAINFFERKSFILPEDTTKEKLFHHITKHYLTTLEGKKKLPIGINFAYPLKPLLHHGFIDGELMYMAKGRNIKGLVGRKVGQEYHRFLIKEYDIDTQVTVANDAICLLLGAEGAPVAGVVGTGLNFAYWEKRTSISPVKLKELYGFGGEDVAVNIESKNFNKINHNKILNILDEKSSDRGFSLAEKQASGAYLYKIFNIGMELVYGKKAVKVRSTDELNSMLLVSNDRTNQFPEDQAFFAALFAERVFHRSAQVVAIELCGILKKLKKTKGLVNIVMEGGIFWKAHNYPALVNLYMNMILPDVIPSFARLFGSSRRGIAILALGE